jgi:hypothetical protein
MNDEASTAALADEPTTTSRRAEALRVAGFASVGAGAIHAVAIGVHSEHDQVMATFLALTVFQIGWGLLTALRPNRFTAAVLAAGNAGAVVGWLMAVTSGISFIDGLEAAEPVELGNTMAAALALASTLVAVASLLRVDRATSRSSGRVVAGAALAAVVLAIPGMASAARPSHEHADGAAHAEGEGHDDGAAHEDAAAHADDAAHEDAAAHTETVIAPVPYDPQRPIDLGGVEGVTAEEQARAENLIAQSLADLPQYADPAVAEAAGFRSIHDGGTGYEHYINREFMADGVVLDSDRPESLVYQIRGGEKTLVAAMYMAEPGTTLDTVPALGGPLTQWHIHNNLCFTASGQVAGLTNAEGTCDPPLVQPEAVPMIHVWIVPHECGPFAALEGIAGGQIPEGETRLCDHAHGAP